MKLTPILFSTPMVEAILAGTKTQTRRIATNDSTTEKIFWQEKVDTVPKGEYTGWVKQCSAPLLIPIECPYGVVGDRLYVREEHYRFGKWMQYSITKTGKPKWNFVPTSDRVLFPENAPAINYPSRVAHNKKGNWEGMPTWYKRLARFMPKSYARIWLEITDIRTEQLQDMSQEDARDEGAGYAPHRPSSSGCKLWVDHSLRRDCCICDFRMTWMRINGESGRTWDFNPWVWVISFKTMTTTGIDR